MFARYVVSLVALEETLKNKLLFMDFNPTEEQVELALKTAFPNATKTYWSVTLLHLEPELILN